MLAHGCFLVHHFIPLEPYISMKGTRKSIDNIVLKTLLSPISNLFYLFLKVSQAVSVRRILHLSGKSY